MIAIISLCGRSHNDCLTKIGGSEKTSWYPVIPVLKHNSPSDVPCAPKDFPLSKVPFSVNKYAVFINDVKVRLTKVYEFALLTMYSMYYESSMRKAILYIAALLMINVQCKSSVPNGTTKSTNRIPTIKRSNVKKSPSILLILVLFMHLK